LIFFIIPNLLKIFFLYARQEGNIPGSNQPLE
jgi:hypothetical protein